MKSVEEEVKTMYNNRVEGKKKDDEDTSTYKNKFKFNNNGGPTINLEKKNVKIEINIK